MKTLRARRCSVQRPGVTAVEVATQAVDPLSAPLLMLRVHRWIRSRESPEGEGGRDAKSTEFRQDFRGCNGRSVHDEPWLRARLSAPGARRAA